MAIKVKHEGNATSKIVAAGAGGAGKRAAEDAKWMAELAAREQMNADQQAQQRQLQTMQMAASMARPGSTSAQLTHAPTSSAPLGNYGGTTKTTTGTGGTGGATVIPSGAGASGKTSPGGILRNPRGEVFRVAPGQDLRDVAKSLKMSGGSGATGSYVMPMKVVTEWGDIPGTTVQKIVPDESRIGGDSAAYMINKGWQSVVDRKGFSRSDSASVDGFEFIPDNPGVKKIAGPEFNNAAGGGGGRGGGGSSLGSQVVAQRLIGDIKNDQQKEMLDYQHKQMMERAEQGSLLSTERNVNQTLLRMLLNTPPKTAPAAISSPFPTAPETSAPQLDKQFEDAMSAVEATIQRARSRTGVSSPTQPNGGDSLREFADSVAGQTGGGSSSAPQTDDIGRVYAGNGSIFGWPNGDNGSTSLSWLYDGNESDKSLSTLRDLMGALMRV